MKDVFDGSFKIALIIFIEYFMKFINVMDVLKIFSKPESVPKDLLSKNTEVREVVQEKDILLKNSKGRIQELEQKINELEADNRQLRKVLKQESKKNTIKEYEALYSKIMKESEQIVYQKNQLEANLNEMKTFCADLMKKHEKAKFVIQQYQTMQDQLKNQVLEYEEIINSLNEEYNKLKEYTHNKLGESDSKSGFQQSKFKDLLIKSKLQREYSKSMFEPLKGLDK